MSSCTSITGRDWLLRLELPHIDCVLNHPLWVCGELEVVAVRAHAVWVLSRHPGEVGRLPGQVSQPHLAGVGGGPGGEHLGLHRPPAPHSLIGVRPDLEPELGDRGVGADHPLQAELCRLLLVSHPLALELGRGGLARHLDSGPGLPELILRSAVILSVDLCFSWKMINVRFASQQSTVRSTSKRTFTFNKTDWCI